MGKVVSPLRDVPEGGDGVPVTFDSGQSAEEMVVSFYFSTAQECLFRICCPLHLSELIGPHGAPYAVLLLYRHPHCGLSKKYVMAWDSTDCSKREIAGSRMRGGNMISLNLKALKHSFQ